MAPDTAYCPVSATTSRDDDITMPPKVDETKCTGCGTCVDVCPSECFTLENNISKVTSPDDCVECESCVENCPENAVTLE